MFAAILEEGQVEIRLDCDQQCRKPPFNFEFAGHENLQPLIKILTYQVHIFDFIRVLLRESVSKYSIHVIRALSDCLHSVGGEIFIII